MQTSKLGRDFIISFEKVRTAAYDDGCGVWTIGIGRIRGVMRGDTCTAEQAHEWFTEELQVYEGAVRSCVKVPVNQCQFDALTSFTYNCGREALRFSSLLMRLNEGNYQAAASGLLLWDKGKVNGVLQSLPGLTKRRQAEKKIFETGIYDMHDGPSVDGNVAAPDFTDVAAGSSTTA